MTAPISPTTAPRIASTRMKTYFMLRGAGGVPGGRRARALAAAPSSWLHLLGAGDAEDLADRSAALRGTVHGDAEAVVGEPRLERRRGTEARQAPQRHDTDD